MKSLHLLIILLFILLPGLMGQENSTSLYEHSLQISNAGMMVLGTWALSNLTVGGIGWARSEGSRKYFHQMNLFWNTVNLSIAGIALYGNLTQDYSLWSSEEMLASQLKTQRLLLINGALDVAYMGTGLLLRRLSLRSEKHRDRLLGYGNSVILQGAFLFVFDLVLYGIHAGHRNQWLEQVSLHVSPGQLSFYASIPF